MSFSYQQEHDKGEGSPLPETLAFNNNSTGSNANATTNNSASTNNNAFNCFSSFSTLKMNNPMSTPMLNGHPTLVQVPVGMGSNSNKKKGRRKIKIEFIEDKSKRHVTLSKRKAGIMKKAYELSTLTGTQCLLLIASETGHVYTFSTPKLQPLITRPEGKNLIQACLNASVPVQPTEDEDSPNNYTTIEPTTENDQDRIAKQYLSTAVERHAAPSTAHSNSLPLQLPAGSSHLFTQQLNQMQQQYGNTPYSALLSSAAIFSAASQAAAQAGAPSPLGSPNVSISTASPAVPNNPVQNGGQLPFLWPTTHHREQPVHVTNSESL